MDALICASDKSVRAILMALCDDHSVKRKAIDLLDLLEPEANAKAKAPEMVASITKKRKAECGIAICVQCGDSFDENDNEKKECRYHSGVMEPDYDADIWADHDEDCHGTIDSDEMREEYPEGFTWTCCEKIGTKRGCKLGFHQSNPEKSKKGCYENGNGDSGSDEVCNETDSSDEEEGEHEGEDEGRNASRLSWTRYNVSDLTINLERDENVKWRALEYLKHLEPEAKTKAKAIGSESINKKRKAEYELSICAQCDKPFNEKDNAAKDCRFHPGVLDYEGRSSGCCDECADPYGLMEKVWTCCEAGGSNPGCRRGRHESDPERAQKAKQLAELGAGEYIDALKEGSDGGEDKENGAGVKDENTE
ncbi:hypothetical protein QBC46DRAFT_358212 [Diplogelasinospora grovesii]|uniref:C2H2-type domain-containing protein n=1 Tax=Diplogelasinospora grovesii TaxID=303347 RepID=A0AAN6MXU3_9PEZI|nr:hypothetical protein QBC46DRAFT_358212 [Diplogelasinospora grovesii]